MRAQNSRLKSIISAIDTTEGRTPNIPRQQPLPTDFSVAPYLPVSPTRSSEFDAVRNNIRKYSRGLFFLPMDYTTSISLLAELQTPKMPPRGLSDYFLSSFHDTFHVNTPVVEWSSFLNHYNECYQAGSLHGRPGNFVALFFAVLAIGSLQSLGSGDGEAIKHGSQFFEEARRALGGRVGSLTLDHCRVALMLSVYCMETNMRPMCRTWLATALAFSVELGLHQNVIQGPTQEAEMRRIVWFSIYARDRYSSLKALTY